MDAVWEELHASRPWGKYPAETLIRLAMRTYRTPEIRAQTKVLELGCGAGANLSFLLAEGFQTYGLDGAPTAIAKAEARLRPLVKDGQTLDLKTMTFEELPSGTEQFDLIVDHFAIYANPLTTITQTYDNVYRMLADGGRFYASVWGRQTTGADSGVMIETATSQNPTCGPCKEMGVSHFFDRPEIEQLFAAWSELTITRRLTDEANGDTVEEFIIWAQK